STPRSYLSAAALGLSEAAPRALPQDFAVALASHLLDGGLVVTALLVAGLWLAGWGAARLTTTVLSAAGVGGPCVAVTLTIWNPYVAERLLQGHWSLLVGSGCLPWVAATVLRLRTTEARTSAVFALVFWTALAGLTPTGLMLAATVALTCVAAPGPGRPRWLCAALALSAAVFAAVPWLTAAAVSGSLSSSEASGITAFAARAEPGLGTLGSLASLGGIWNAEAVPASRTTLFALVAAVVLLAVVALGLPAVLRRPAAVRLLLLAAVAVVVPAAMATGPGLALVRAIVEAAPGLGVIRDGQKWVALAVPGYALAGAGAVLTLRRHLSGWIPGPAAAAACCVALLVVLPDLVWGVGGKVAAVRYPPGWAATAAAINADPRPVAVLGAGTMRRFAWSGGAPVLDPLPRWVRADVLSTGDLTISGRTVPGEGGRARDVQRLLLAGADRDALDRAGVGWVVVESGADGEIGPAAKTLNALPVAYRDGDLTVYRVGGDYPAASAQRRGVMVAAHLAWLAMLVAGAAGMAVAGLRRTPASHQAADPPSGVH
ncbi:MAG: hypothetical protein JWR37_3021, partial [Mycobacterium sp.]|nr:hypothetical protein [Mycobacterium sp.]